ncbi:glycosyltransferase family 4 protein [Fervidobacterium nodosum]|uniref:Glycosyl transferase family 4 n=1 Tax=Fervidobacterium nodosum (strain ATCC 35602 / DSM 5306 / Rt17-B1) TaxID=381764 RepID=A7HKE6_FERNB|nr:MraY family glycosyltransferase [Fervidobacterium nodosum]ABS60379.1 glycosyl transferase family 4 [Fervidobacterium nodosum Rt17-B1]PHJ14293.1 glycosyl transferase [Fervidobacterium sp. SC_NGM5_G05]
MFSPILMIVSLIISALTVPIFGKIAYKYNIVDKPDDGLKEYERITPYLGGLAIYLAVIVSTPFEIITKFSLTLLTIIGLIDDVKKIKLSLKLAVELFVALILTYKYVGFNWFFPLYIFLVVILINSVKMMDEMDGVCASVSIISAIGLSILVSSRYDGMLLSALIGAVFGYFIYNFPPARISMGSSGGYFVGGVLSIGLLSTMRHGSSNIPYLISAFIFISLFYFNFLSGLSRSTLNKKPIYLYNKIYEKFNDKRKTLYTVVSIQLLVFLLGYFSKTNVIASISALIILLVIYFALGKFLNVFKY